MAERRRRSPRSPFPPFGSAQGRRQRPRQSDNDDMARWQTRVAHARKVRQDWEVKYHVKQLEEMYLGHQVAETGDADDLRNWFNHWYATLQTQRPALLPRVIRFVVQARPGKEPMTRLESRVQAGLLEAIAQQDDHLDAAARLALTQAFFRVGVLKVSYDVRMAPNPQKGEPLVGDFGQPLLDEDGTPLLEPSELLSDEVYAWWWVNAARMLFPDEGPDMRRWTWIGEECEVLLEEAKQDPRFPKRLRDQLTVNASLDADGSGRSHVTASGTVDVREEELGRFRYTECWDILAGKCYVWAEGQDFDDFLVNGQPYDGIEEHPYSILAPTAIVGPEPSPWPVPLTYNWLPLQREYNTMRDLQIQAGKRAARKILYDANTFPDEEEARKALASTVDMEAARVNDVARPPLLFADGAQSPDVARNVPFLIQDWQRITGTSGTRLGSAEADTATESVLIEQAASVRESDLQTLIQRWLALAGKKMLQLVRQTLTLDVFVKLRTMADADFQEFIGSPGFRGYLATRLGPQAVPQFLQMLAISPALQEQLKTRFGDLRPLRVTRSELQFEADVSVLPSTIKPLYQARLLQLAKLLGPAALLSPTLVEELLESFDLPFGEQIAEELLANLQRQNALSALQGSRAAPREGLPQPGQGNGATGVASPLGPSGGNPLAAVNGGVQGV